SRLAVTSKSCEELRHGFERLQEVKGADAASGTLRLAILLAQYKNGTTESLDQPAGHNAHHSPMPRRSAEHECRALIRNRSLGAVLGDDTHDFGLRLLPFLVELVELPG